jgi:hypothetical protein
MEAYMSNHKFEAHASSYISRGYSVIPDKFRGKMPAIKGWSEYCDRKPTDTEVKQWTNSLTESNISLCLGEASGVIAVDVDTEDAAILELIREHLLPSPYEKIGNKGFTRFYRYTTETTQIFKHNKSVLFELLSTGKKTTLPPSVHPNGMAYRWSGPSLTEVDPAELPVLPPFNLSRVFDMIRDKFPEAENVGHGSFTTNGRNDALVSLCGKLIGQKKSADEIIRELVEFDKREHKPAYFTDPEEQRHLDAYTNALVMYSYQLDRINGIHHRKNEEYETPMLASAINNEYVEAVEEGKSLGQESEKRSKKIELPTAQGVIKIIQQNILDNSWIKQPDLAMSAALGLMAVITSRKFIFGNLTTNLYLLNISPSGSGKDAPQQMVKNYLIDIGADYLLGSGDYVSDASLMDHLGASPIRLDIMDEAGGILKTVTSGRSEYNGKMADVLCELYTSSNSKYLGRTTAEGTKGSCNRPNVSILASTTPTGFSEGVTRSALDKGLLGRFLTFFGDGNSPAKRLREFPRLDKDTKDKIKEIVNYKPDVNYELTIGGIEQQVKELNANSEASDMLDQCFEEFDELRRKSDKSDPMLPITSRLYQQMVKIVILHAISREGVEAVINTEDVKFAKSLILYYYSNMTEAVNTLVYTNHSEKAYADILKIIPLVGQKGISKQSLSTKTRHLGKRRRDELIQELVENGEVMRDIRMVNDRQCVYYWRTR